MARKPKKPIFQSPKGMSDILPRDQVHWNVIRDVVRGIAEFYNFGRIDTPMLEAAQLFTKGIGEGTDIIEKEMYTLKTKGGDKLVLRPEGTVAIMRAYIEHRLHVGSQPTRFYYLGPMFRHESPQKWRYRQFHQFGLEVVGDQNNIYDAQIILIFFKILEELKVKNVVVKINSIGDRACRVQYRNRLKAYYKDKLHLLSKEGKDKFSKDPLKALDSKNENDLEVRAGAPVIIDDLSPACHEHFKGVLEFLDSLHIPYHLDPHLVRGLDYYNRTVFEILPEGGGDEIPASQSTLIAGGRYDYLAEMIGRRSAPGVGGAMGIERIIEYMKELNNFKLPNNDARVYLVQLGDLAKKKALHLMEEFRRAGIPVLESLGRDSIKAQLHVADRVNADVALIMGQKEAHEGNVIIRDMHSGSQETTPMEKLVGVVRKKLAKTDK